MVRPTINVHRRRIWIAVFIIAVLVIFSYESVISSIYNIPEIGTAHPVFLGLPEGYPDRSSQQPYQGPHPSTIKRPPDKFEFPIKLGQVGPKDASYVGPLKYPFLCMTEKSGLGQPLVDNQAGSGIAVYREDQSGERTDEIIGYSKDCMVPTQAWYLYNRVGSQKFYPLSKAKGDITRIEFQDKEIDFVVRVEMEVINRHIYAIISLKGPEDQLDKPDNRYWNGKLIYQLHTS